MSGARWVGRRWVAALRVLGGGGATAENLVSSANNMRVVGSHLFLLLKKWSLWVNQKVDLKTAGYSSVAGQLVSLYPNAPDPCSRKTRLKQLIVEIGKAAREPVRVQLSGFTLQLTCR